MRLPNDIRKSIEWDCTLLVASDTTAWLAEDKDYDYNEFIDELQDVVEAGTLLFPTYNWDYCRGVPFDIAKSKSRTGALGQAALARSDFERTQHPIYSFAVWGKNKEYLCGLRNKTAFGWDSPYAIIDKMLLVNITCQHSLSFAHHVEQILGAQWRFEKDFGGYSMYVRKEGVVTDLLSFEDGDAEFRLLDMAQIFHTIKKDILLGDGAMTHRDKHEEMREYFDQLWPLTRSITGFGARATHHILSDIVPLETHEVPTGTKVFDWEVPQEWTFTDAYIIGPDDRVWLNARDNNLHIVSYSMPFEGKMPGYELMKYLYCASPEAGPDAIPYRTSYYEPAWGFCVSRNQLAQMPIGDFKVVVDTELKDGSLTYSDLVLPGRTDKEIWFSTYTCHPSMANNELSGPLALAFLARMVQSWDNRYYTYRFIFVPETIGALCYLHDHPEAIKHVEAGFEVTCCGDRKPLQYKETLYGSTLADDVAEYVLKGHRIRKYFPHAGADERHYNSLGFNLPIGTIMRSAPGEYPEYHTSLDNQRFISFDCIQETIDTLYRMVEVLEMNRAYKNLYPNGEPMLGRRGIYGEHKDAMRWLLAYPGELLYIAGESGIEIDELHRAATILEAHGLIEEIKD